MVLRTLLKLRHEVSAFKWHGYFSPSRPPLARLTHVLSRAQNKYVTGPGLRRLNHDFVAQVTQTRPDAVFIYRGTHITARALRAVRAVLPECVLVGYNNDNPFAPDQPRYLWRHFIKAIPEYDLMLAYRHSNFAQFCTAGARRTELLRSWYVPDRNYPVRLSAEETSKFGCDVVFIGHYEPDQRLHYLEEIARRGFHLRIYGPSKYWRHPIQKSPILRKLAPIDVAWGEDYNRALCGAKVALCFLSKLNCDTYTRRCFEIPATRTFLLSEYSDDLAGLYQEGVEAEFFRNCEELITKIKKYVSDEPLRCAIAEGGYRKVTTAGHDVESRIRHVLGWIHKLRQGPRLHELK